MRYRFETLHLLDAMVPVNVKDRGQATNAFKLLIFPDARVFQAPSPKAKAEWLEQLEKTKHTRAAAEQQDANEQREAADPHTNKQIRGGAVQQDSVDSHTSEGDDGDSITNPFSSWNNMKPSLPQVWAHHLLHKQLFNLQ